ncbi:hypothetical protein GCM10007854_13250 [Algimonas porphyrae]|uniref:Uncharacterized protein n=1 Tax=Algimonas porphyrae TaxID=1128113 RepID=A0ABQ5UYI3_9PROT|nr:hypothetical protein GCM10007854_13250 [Algimonas porphyrae]
MSAVERIRDDHPYGPLFRAWAPVREARKRRNAACRDYHDAVMRNDDKAKGQSYRCNIRATADLIRAEAAWRAVMRRGAS